MSDTRARRSTRLRVIEPLQLPEDWEIKDGVPKTRAECASIPRPCPHLACREHLWLRLQAEQPGNPRAGKQGTTTFRPSTMASCALDIVDAEPAGASCERVGEVLGIVPTRVRQIEMRAIEKLRAAGVSIEQLLELGS